jgi:PAS domain S-box-containing protein
MNSPADRPASHNPQGHTVLLIDDDPTNLGVISDCLSGAGLEVLIARDGESGLQKARYARPHIILLDAVMPGLDGFETCRRLKSDAATKDIPVLFMTALTGTRDKVRAYEAGAADYVTKPVQVEELLARVRAHLALRSMTQHVHDQDAQVQQAIAEREQAEVARQISEARLRAIIDQLPFDLWAMDDQLRYIMQNATSRQQYGDVIGKRIEDRHLPAEIEARWLEQDHKVLAGETSNQAYELDGATGKRRYENIVAPVKVDEAIVGIVGIAMDVTERKQTEEELRLYREHLEEVVASRTAQLRAEIEERTRIQGELSQANRMLKLLSECNQVLVRTTDEAELLEKICRFIVELGGYPLVWVGLTEPSETEAVRLAAHVGKTAAEVADFIEANRQLEHGPVNSAIRSGQPCIVNDVQTDPGYTSQRAEAIRRGYASLIALPLKVDDQIIGALNIYAAQSNAFHAEEVKLLLELTGDLAYGVLSLRTRAERQQTAAALAEQHRLMRILIDAMPDRIYVKDADSRFLLTNNMVAWIMGTTPEEAIGKRDFDFYSPELAEQYYADEQALLASGQALIDREEPGIDLAGNVHWVSTTKVPFRDEQGKIKGFVGIGRDITVRKEMEAILRQARDELEARVEERTRELRRANERLAGLYQITQTITAPLQLPVVLDAIARGTAELLGSDTGVILLLDEAQEVLTIAGAYGLRAEVVQGTRDRVGDSIAGRVVQTGQPLIANDLPHDERFYNPAAAGEGLLACASVPLIAGGQIIGTLDAHSKTDRQAFTPDHIQILSMLASQAAIAIENARLYEGLQEAHDDLEIRVQQRTAELLTANAQLQQEMIERQRAEQHEHDLAHNLRAVVEAVDELITCADLDTFFRRAVELPREKLGVERSAIFLLDPARQQMRGTYGTDFQGHTTDQHTTNFQPDGLETLLASDARSWMVEEKEYVYRKGDQRYTSGRGWVATTVIRFGNEPIGLFSNDTGISRAPLNEVTQETLVVYCSLLGNIIERKRAEEKITQLNQDLEHRTSELAALNTAGRLLASTLNLDQVLALVMEQIKALVDAEAASVLLCVPGSTDDAPPDLVFAAATGPAAGKLMGTRLSGTAGIAGWVVQTRQSAQITDSQDDPRFYQQVDAVTGMTTHALLAVPLIAKGSLVGVMEVINKRSGRFDAHDLEILEALSSSSAIAIDNARLYATEQQRAAALSRALEQQRELDRLQREFIQNVSHELRTPIGIILGYAELLESGELGGLHLDQREPIRIITRRTHMLRKLVEDITAILEIEAHARSGQHTSLDLAALVQAVINEFQITAEKAHLLLATEIEAAVPPLHGDALALRRVLDNLLSNAFKFTPAGGRVTVRLRPTTEKMILEVSDTGIGIAADKLERIFDRFYQVDGSATRHYGGLGLGLALVKEIVEAHGGQIEVVSQVNVGTTFTITLPLPIDGQVTLY